VPKKDKVLLEATVASSAPVQTPLRLSFLRLSLPADIEIDSL
jgi:hypothetical protein